MFDEERPCTGREHEETECLLASGLGRVKDWKWGTSWEAESVRREMGVSKKEDSPTGQPRGILNKSSWLNTLISRNNLLLSKNYNFFPLESSGF